MLISLLVSTIAAVGSGRTRQAADLRRNAQLRAEADGGVEEAVFHLLDGSRAHWAADGLPHSIRRNGTLLTMRIVNDSGRVNPNHASLDLLTALLQAVGTDRGRSAAIAANIVAWRFPGGDVAVARTAGRDYLPPGAPFETLSELGLVQGMTPALLAALAPHLSLYRDNDPDPALADPVVRQAMQALAGPGAPGDQPALGPSARDETLVTVTADAADAAGHRYRREAIILTGGDETGSDRPFRIMRWDAPST